MELVAVGRAKSERWWAVGFVAIVITGLWLSDWLRPLGPIAGTEPMRLINIVLTLLLAVTGFIQWARTSKRYRHVQWIRQKTFVWTHRIAGIAYIPLILLWDFVFEAEDVGAAESAFIEGLNKPLLIVIATTAALLFLKWPRPILSYYKQVKYVHITATVLYVIKFFAEPFMGGKLG